MPFWRSLLILSGAVLGGGCRSTHLEMGAEAPDFKLPSTTGDEVGLSDFRGKKSVVLAFVPKAFTSG